MAGLPGGAEMLEDGELDALMVDTDDNCFHWNRRPANTGYGCIPQDGGRTLVHRFVYELCIGPIPKGYHVHHTCGNKVCANPLHLKALTPKDHWGQHKTERCKRCGGDNFGTRPDGKRDCKTCAKAYVRERYRTDPVYREKVKARVKAREQAKRASRV